MPSVFSKSCSVLHPEEGRVSTPNTTEAFHHTSYTYLKTIPQVFTTHNNLVVDYSPSASEFRELEFQMSKHHCVSARLPLLQYCCLHRRLLFFLSDMTFVSTRPSFIFMVRPLTTRFPTPLSSVYSCCRTRTKGRCSLW